MKLLDQFISQTGKQPADWTIDEVQQYMDYIKEQAAKSAVSKRYDN